MLPDVMTGRRARLSWSIPVGLLMALLLAAGIAPVARAATSAVPSSLTQRYRLDATIDYAAGAVSARDTITLHANDASFDTLDLSFLPRYLVTLGRAGYGSTIGPVTVDGVKVTASFPNTTTYRVALGRTISAGQNVTVVVPFTLKVGTSSDAFGARLSRSNGIFDLFNWFPIVSILHGVSTIGDPQVTWNAASIELHLTTTVAFGRDAVAASGDLISAPAAGTKGTGWVFRATNVRDFGLSISPGYRSCTYETGNAAKTVIKAYAKSASLCSTLRTNTANAFARYSSAYGAYPYHTLSMVQSGNAGFSVEVPTLVFLGSDMIGSTAVTWHETAHQWFYGLLGDNQLTEPLIDEGLATFSTKYFLGLSFSYCSGYSVNHSIFFFSAWNGCGNYLRTVFDKGASMWNRIRAAMGSSAFFAALRSYIAGHRYGLVGLRRMLGYLDGQTSAVLTATYCPYVTWC